MKKTMQQSDIDMLKSCYLYGYLGWSSYYKNIVEKYGEEETERQVEILQSTYDIKTDVYTDGEGVSYNSLIKK